MSESGYAKATGGESRWRCIDSSDTGRLRSAAMGAGWQARSGFRVTRLALGILQDVVGVVLRPEDNANLIKAIEISPKHPKAS